MLQTTHEKSIKIPNFFHSSINEECVEKLASTVRFKLKIVFATKKTEACGFRSASLLKCGAKIDNSRRRPLFITSDLLVFSHFFI